METTATFTNAERLRLQTYRAAIHAGFYTDACDESGSFSEDDFHSLTSNEAELIQTSYPFNEDELIRLTQY